MLLHGISFILVASLVSSQSLDSPSYTVLQPRTPANDGRIEKTATSLIVPSWRPEPPSVTEEHTKNVSTLTNLWGWKGCIEDQKTAIRQGLAEAQVILQRPEVLDLDSHFHDFAVVEYLGSPWYMHSYKEVKDEVKDKFAQASAFRNSWWSWTSTEVICLSDDTRVCIDEPSFIKVDNAKTATLTFCQRYFSLGSLDAIYKQAQSGPFPHDLSQYENRARAWSTAIMRTTTYGRQDKGSNYFRPMPFTHPKRKIPQFAESASQCKYLAKHDARSLARTTNNPSNFAWYALAQYVQAKSRHYPNQPYTPRDLRNRDGF